MSFHKVVEKSAGGGNVDEVSLTDVKTTKEDVKVDGRMVVALGFRIYNIININVADATALVDFRLFAEWVDLTIKGKNKKEVDDGTLWKPTLEIANATESEEVDSGIRVMDNEGSVKWHCRYRVTIAQRFDLRNFPYDAHALQLHIRMPRLDDNEKVRAVVANPERTSGPDCMNEFFLEEWDVKRPSHVCERIKDKPHFTIELLVSRKSRYYEFNIILIMACLTSMALVAFVMEPDDVADRSAHIITLLLTAVAFKFVIADVLPKTGYLTFVDKYVLSCFGLLFFCEVETGVVGMVCRYSDKDTAVYIDHACAIGFIALLLLIQVVFGVRSYLSKNQPPPTSRISA